MPKKIVNLGGRPTIYSPSIVEKLVEVFKIGGSVDEACANAKIDVKTYYNWLDKNTSFSNEIASAQHYSDIAAKNVVVGSILKHKNIESSKWWLEKRVFKQQTNNVQNNIQIVVPNSLQNKYGVSSSTRQDSE